MIKVLRLAVPVSLLLASLVGCGTIHKVSESVPLTSNSTAQVVVRPFIISNSPSAKTIIKASARTASVVAQPNIVSRLMWKAKAARGEMKPHIPHRITIHHTASPQSKKTSIEQKMRGLQEFSQRKNQLASGKRKPGWSDVPYHFYIAADGKIAEGRDINFMGDTNTDYKPAGHILVVLEGNFEKEQPTVVQLLSLRGLTSWLAAKWRISASQIKGHNDYASTACPGRNLKQPIAQLRQNDLMMGETSGAKRE